MQSPTSVKVYATGRIPRQTPPFAESSTFTILIRTKQDMALIFNSGSVVPAPLSTKSYRDRIQIVTLSVILTYQTPLEYSSRIIHTNASPTRCFQHLLITSSLPQCQHSCQNLLFSSEKATAKLNPCLCLDFYTRTIRDRPRDPLLLDANQHEALQPQEQALEQQSRRASRVEACPRQHRDAGKLHSVCYRPYFSIAQGSDLAAYPNTRNTCVSANHCFWP